MPATDDATLLERAGADPESDVDEYGVVHLSPQPYPGFRDIEDVVHCVNLHRQAQLPRERGADIHVVPPDVRRVDDDATLMVDDTRDSEPHRQHSALGHTAGAHERPGRGSDGSDRCARRRLPQQVERSSCDTIASQVYHADPLAISTYADTQDVCAHGVELDADAGSTLPLMLAAPLLLSNQSRPE